MTARVALAPAAALILALAACSSSASSVTRVTSTSGPATLTGPPAQIGHAYSLDLLDPASTVRVETADLGGKLFRVTTGQNGATTPLVRAAGDNGFAISLTGGGASDVTIDIARGVVWSLQFSAGLSTATVDTTGATLHALTTLAGITSLTVTAGAPTGTATITESGGLSALALHVPAATAVSVAALGGAGSVSLFGAVHSGIAAGTVIATPQPGTDVYDVVAQGGVSSVLVST